MEPTPSFNSDRESLPRLAVIVRTLGRSHLGDALESLAAQTRRDFETVVVDMSEGAARETIASRAAFVPGLRHIVTPGRIGRSEALNLGIASSEAPAIAILDDDNVYTDTHVDTLVRGLETTGADLVYTGILRRTLTPRGDLVHEEIRRAPFDADRLLFANYIYATGTAFRRDIWERAGGYDPRFPVYEDWEFLIRLAATGRIASLPVVSGVSRAFTGDVARPAHQDDIEECWRCAAGLFWTHRDRYTKTLFDARPDLVVAHPEVPLGGTKPELEPLVRAWLTLQEMDRLAS